MLRYFFSIFTRGLLAFSGILVFLVSAKLFGAEGRGIISYGSSLFASFGLLFSFNLGRAFIQTTTDFSKNQSFELRSQIFPKFIFLNSLAILLTAVSGFLFWKYTNSAQNILNPTMIAFFALTSSYYVWNINGNVFFSAFVRITTQDILILLQRLILVLALAYFYLTPGLELISFIKYYCLILGVGAFLEIKVLSSLVRRNIQNNINLDEVDDLKQEINLKQDFNLKSLVEILKSSVLPHLDFLAFNLFPLILVIISGFYLNKAEIGRASFAIQIVNLIFLLSITGNNKVNTYVSDVGIDQRWASFKKLYLGTLGLSLFVGFMMYLVLNRLDQSQNTENFFKVTMAGFSGISSLFLLTLLAIPGYVTYQLLSPVGLEKKLVKKSAFFNAGALALSLLLAPWLLLQFGEKGMIYSYGFFHVLLFIAQVFVFRKYLSFMMNFRP